MAAEPTTATGRVVLVKKIIMKDGAVPQQGIGRPSVYHAVMVIFLEFFAWGLLTTPMLTVSNWCEGRSLKFNTSFVLYLLMNIAPVIGTLPSYSGPAVVHVCSSDRSAIGRMGSKIFPSDHRLLHLRSDPSDEAQPLVGLHVICSTESQKGTD
ncbi:hypothetical protein XENOCAPTIV_014935 [Xenoophorus captivus]|uniref:Uncharacterized protein n=1 Tax=Xenoophorus captivus TaxID=1517983 RepID=A0ABV0RWR7_9TELE